MVRQQQGQTAQTPKQVCAWDPEMYVPHALGLGAGNRGGEFQARAETFSQTSKMSMSPPPANGEQVGSALLGVAQREVQNLNN